MFIIFYSSKKDDQSPAAQNELDYEYYQSDEEFDLSKDSNSAAQNDESIPIDVNIFGKETAAPPPTPREATEEGYAATHPVTATADEPEIPFTQAEPTIMKRRVKEITTIKRQKKNLEGGFLNIRVNVSSDNFPNISIKNRKPLLPNVQFINNEGCRRHHIVAWTLVKDVCIDCGKESFTERDYARNRALDDVLGRYSHSEQKRSSNKPICCTLLLFI